MTNLPPQQWFHSQDEVIVPRLVSLCIQLVCFAAVIALFRVSGVEDLDALEIDFLATGHRLAEVMEHSDGPWMERLEAGFELPADHPDLHVFRGSNKWRRAFSDSPATRWISGLVHLWAGDRNMAMETGQWLARLWILLSALLMANLAQGLLSGVHSESVRTWVGLIGGLVFLALPGALSATGAAGAVAFSAFAMTLFMSETIRYRRLQREAWRLGLAWGLILSLHPAGIFMLLPLLAVMLIRPTVHTHESVGAGTLPLPVVSLGLFVVPVLGIFFLIALWPSLWAEPGRGLVAWFSETAWRLTMSQQILGVNFEAVSGRSPHVWVGILQWINWTPLSLMAACAAGLLAWRRGQREGLLVSCLLLGAMLFVGGMNGGLSVGRNRLWPWCWAPTTLLAMQGGIYLANLAMRRMAGVARMVSAVLVAVLLIAPLGSVFARSSAGFMPSPGALERMPVPLAHLREMAALTPEGSVHIASGLRGYRYAVNVLGESAGLALSWSERQHADWLIVVDTGSSKLPAGMDDAKAGEEPVWEETIEGIGMSAYRRIALK